MPMALPAVSNVELRGHVIAAGPQDVRGTPAVLRMFPESALVNF
jgi:hypothetical protein